MQFLNRAAELDRLDAVLLRRPGSFAAIWGRRRVGKSRLLLEWSARHDGLYTVADLSAAPVQRRYLAEAVAQRFPDFASVEYPDWRSFLDRLRAEAVASSTGRGRSSSTNFRTCSPRTRPSPASSRTGSTALRPRPSLVVSGSSWRMMHGALLGAGAPLYGRAVEAFAVQPLRPGHAERCLPGCQSARAGVALRALGRHAAVLGTRAERFGTDLEAAVDALVLDPAGPLHDEPDRLLREETPSASSLRPLLDVIGAGSHRISEIAGRLGKPASSLSGPLATLCEMRLLHREIPFGSPASFRKTQPLPDRGSLSAALVPGGRAPPRVTRRGASGNTARVLDARPARPPRVPGVGGAVPDGGAHPPPDGLAGRRPRPLGARAALLAAERARGGPRRAVGGRQAAARGRGEVDGGGTAPPPAGTAGLPHTCPARAAPRSFMPALSPTPCAAAPGRREVHEVGAADVLAALR